MIALELMGESWYYTGWYKHDGWYGKPWVWSVISNFGDNVSMFGGLGLIAANLEKALESPEKGNLSGMGMMMEGLDYNPVTYKLVADMMWETGKLDINVWKYKYLRSRYGTLNRKITNAWDPIFNYYYSLSEHDTVEGHFGIFEKNPIIERPHLVVKDVLPPQAAIECAAGLISLSEELGHVDAYQYDLVHLFRQISGQYANHLLYEITTAYMAKDISRFNASVTRFTGLALDIEKLISTREEFLLGKWIADSRERATNEDEAKLFEWNARAIITTWGGEMLYGYAQKDWAGLYSSYYLPKWNSFFDAMRTEITGGKKLDYDNFIKELKSWENEWNNIRGEQLSCIPSGKSIEIAREMWQKYGRLMTEQ
jgi:alpha-N-acetylglucosaminidase